MCWLIHIQHIGQYMVFSCSVCWSTLGQYCYHVLTDIFICMECHHWGKRSVWTNYFHGHKFIKNIARQDRQTFATGQSAFKTAALATEMTKNWVDSKYNSRRRICYISIYSIGRMLMAYWAICWLIISQILTNTISQLILWYASDVQTICWLTYHLTHSWLMFTYIDQ